MNPFKMLQGKNGKFKNVLTYLIEFFLNNTTLTFLAVLYKIDIKISKNKVATTVNWTHNTGLEF